MYRKPDSKQSTLKLLTWNIDGLDSRNIDERTLAVCEKVRELQPDVLFIQEVIPHSWKILTSSLTQYQHFCKNNKLRYFHIISVRKDTLEVVGDKKIMDFPGTKMGRHLLTCQVQFGKLPIYLLSSHIESMLKAASERKCQLREVFAQMSAMKVKGDICIFGGDLNVNDEEIQSVGIPHGIVDVWEACGSPKEHKYSWDTKTNDNFGQSCPDEYQVRLDRLYLCPPDEEKIKPQGFTLIGTERVTNIGRFPSDHYGIYVEFLC